MSVGQYGKTPTGRDDNTRDQEQYFPSPYSSNESTTLNSPRQAKIYQRSVYF